MAKILEQAKAVKTMSPMGARMLGLTSESCMDRLTQIAGDLYGRDDSGAPWCFFDRLGAVGSGSTYADHGGGVSAGIGVRDFYLGAPNAPVPDKMFLSAVHALCHEREHVRQFTDPQTPPEIVMALNGAHEAGFRYYQEIYGTNLAEIEADQVGVNACWDIMRQHFGDKGEQAMLRYINKPGANGMAAGFGEIRREEGPLSPLYDQTGVNRLYDSAYDRALFEKTMPPPAAFAEQGSHVEQILSGPGNEGLKQWLNEEHPSFETMAGLTAIRMEFDPAVKPMILNQLGIKSLDVKAVTGHELSMQGLKADTVFGYEKPVRSSPIIAAEQPEPVRKALETYQRVEERRIQLQQEAQLDTGVFSGRQFRY